MAAGRVVSTPCRLQGMGSLSQERELISLTEGGGSSYPLYRGKGEDLEEVITCDLGCSLVVVNDRDPDYFKKREVCSKLA